MTRIRIAILASFLLTGVLAIGQQPIPALPPGAKKAEKDKDKSATVEVMTFPSDRDAKNMITAVKDYLKEYKDKDDKAPWDRICKAAQQVLNAKSDTFYELPKPTPDAPQARVSAKAEINRLIGEFSKAGREFYQQAYGAEAERLLVQAKNSFYDRSILADVSQRFFHTKPGAEATLLLAAVQLERGNFAEAAYSYERMLTRPDSDDYWTPLTLYRAITALKRAGAATNSPSLKKLQAEFEKKFPREGIAIGRRSYSMDELASDWDKPLETSIMRMVDSFISMRYGNASHTAISEGGKPFLDPTWSQTMFRHMTPNHPMQQGNIWVKTELEELLRQMMATKGEVVLPGFFPATSKNLIFYRGYDGVYAYVTKDGFSNHGKPARQGELYWYAPTRGGAASLYSGSVDKLSYSPEDVNRNWQNYRTTQPHYKSLLFENPLNGSLSLDNKAVYIVDECAIPPMPQTNNGDFGMPMPGIAGTPAATPTGKANIQNCNFLRSLNIETGKNNWVLGETYSDKPLTDEDEEKTSNTLFLMQNSFFLGPPLPINGKLYILYERNGAIHAACLDPNRIERFERKREYTLDVVEDGKVVTKKYESKDTIPYPALVWTQKLGEPIVRLPQETARRFQCSYLAYADGVLICPTNAGAIVAVDVMNRSLLWARSYRSVKTTRPNNPGFNPNGQPMAGQFVLNADRWRAAAPIISQNRIVFAAFDSDDLTCLDLRSGDVLWKQPRQKNDLYIGGLMNDNVIIVGRESVRAVKLFGTPKDNPTDAKEDIATPWKEVKIGLPAGHGAASKDGIYYIPLVTGTEGPPMPQVWALDVTKGEIVAKAAYRKKDVLADKTNAMLGNLVFHEGQLFVQTPLEVASFPLIELKKQEMNRLLAANPNDPDGLVARGELSLDEGNYSAAIDDFQLASRHNPSEIARFRLREKLFIAYTELLRRDFNAAEKYLPEYKTLCDVAVVSEDPNEMLRQKEELDRRQRLYLELLAKGREAQGKFTEAFDHYRAFASYGGNKELVTVADEPNGKTRPDVWARGRIEQMIRNAKDDAAKNALKELVDREWAGVRDGKNLAKLREFVGIFGSHVAVGREAELLLGETLIVSEKETEQREAQGVLTRLSTTAEEDIYAARAIEALAKLATRKGQGEVAISYYVRLGTRYAETKLRDDTTGADLLNGLLTDKRLLPYLEPARMPTPAKVKALRDNSNTGFFNGNVIEPEGSENEPFYRRHRLTLSNENNNSWVLRVLDKASGEEKWKVGGLQMYTPTGGFSSRIAQARGSLLLLHMGLKIYCFDLAEKKSCWEFPIIGDSSRIDFNNPRYEASADEDLAFIFTTDGIKLSIGRTGVLEANYAALINRDGLVAIDPVTGSKLWTRTNISPASIIYGDARHIFVVEIGAGKNTTKVLRAIDGATVEGIPDFGALATGSGRIRVVGRNLLLQEGGRLKPLTIRLYDPLTGKDVWKKEYAPVAEPKNYQATGLEFNGQAKLIRTFDSKFVGALERDGKFEVLDVNTGKVVFASKLVSENADLHASMAGQPILLNDAERFYLILNKTGDPNARNPYMYSSIRMLPVDGPLYCYERGSGKQTWFVNALLEKQQLVVERFGEMPALVAATFVNEDVENGVPVFGRRSSGGNMVYRVAVIDKVNGRLRYLQNITGNNGSQFYAMATDPRFSLVRLFRGDMTLVVSPDDGTDKTSTAPKSAVAKPAPSIPTTPAP